MSDYEASAEIRPQIKLKMNKSRKVINSYFLVICVLFILIVMLGANNIILYKAFKNFHHQYFAAYSSMNSVSSENANLIKERETLVKEAADFKKENDELKAANSRIVAQNNEILLKLNDIKAANDELIRNNKELVDDNIALQNSLKKAAAVGIKPQNYTSFDGLSDRGVLNRGRYIGKFVGTAYTPSSEECGNDYGITNSGKPIVPGISVAVDRRFWPFGTVFYIRGLGYAVAMDTGGAIKGKQRFDFAVFDKNFAKTLGTKKWEVYLVKLGDGKVRDVRL